MLILWEFYTVCFAIFPSLSSPQIFPRFPAHPGSYSLFLLLSQTPSSSIHVCVGWLFLTMGSALWCDQWTRCHIIEENWFFFQQPPGASSSSTGGETLYSPPFLYVGILSGLGSIQVLCMLSQQLWAHTYICPIVSRKHCFLD